MRLVLLCLTLILAPAGALLVTDRYVSNLEDEFFIDSTRQVRRLERLLLVKPEAATGSRLGIAMAELEQYANGAGVARRICSGAPNPAFLRLFDVLQPRCNQWELYRRARWGALLATAFTAGALALVLIARIIVRRYANGRRWPHPLKLWFVMRGVKLLLLLQTVAALAPCWVILKSTMSKPYSAAAVLAVPGALLVWLERTLMKEFVETRKLNIFRPKGILRPTRRRRAYS